MSLIIESTNPFSPFKDRVIHEWVNGGTVLDWLKQTKKGFVEFTTPTICLRNGDPLLRSEWDKTEIKEDDVICFISVPGDPITIFYIVVAVVSVAAIVLALNVPKPTIPGEIPSPDPVYGLQGQKNQNRLGNPIESPYGRNRLWPSYAARPYNRYIENNQWQYSLFCLGQGKYDVEAVQIEDTPVSSFEDVEIEIYEPGQVVTLIQDNVITSVEVAGLELHGPNEAGYTGFLGGYIANPTGTQTTSIELDIVLPQGLYTLDNNSNVSPLQVTATFEYREVDGTGAPIGLWSNLAYFDKTLATNTPQRFTIATTVPSGRYEVRGVRTNNKDTSTRSSNLLRWDALRAILPSTKVYPGVTVCAMKARASNNLNDNSAARLNIIATRKLPTWNGTTWTSEIATRSPIWALCDVFRSNYGGSLADQFLDLAGLLAHANQLQTDGIQFDWVFDQKTTVWEAARTVARVARAVPLLDGSRVIMIRDTLKTIPTAIFNPWNMVEGSFRWELKLPNIDDYDGVEIEYTDPTTFLPEVVLCKLPDEAGIQPEKIKLPGCTNRDNAYREGMYIRSSRRKLNSKIQFSTELDGMVPIYNDLIKVCHDVPRWGQGGYVTEISSDHLTIHLSEPVSFGAGTHVLGLRDKKGGFVGPYTVTATTDPKVITSATPVDISNLSFASTHEPPLFVFGSTSSFGKLCKVSRLSPNGDNTVSVECLVDDTTVFDYDTATAPALPTSTAPDPIPTVPQFTGNEDSCDRVLLTADPLVPLKYKLSWAPAFGASSYIVEISYDSGVSWTVIAATSSYEQNFIVEDSSFYVRVAPIGKGKGLYCTKASETDITEGPAPEEGNPTGPSVFTDYFPPGAPFITATPTISAFSAFGNNTIVPFFGFYQGQKHWKRQEITGSAPLADGVEIRTGVWPSDLITSCASSEPSGVTLQKQTQYSFTTTSGGIAEYNSITGVLSGSNTPIEVQSEFGFSKVISVGSTSVVVERSWNAGCYFYPLIYLGHGVGQTTRRLAGANSTETFSNKTTPDEAIALWALSHPNFTSGLNPITPLSHTPICDEWGDCLTPDGQSGAAPNTDTYYGINLVANKIKFTGTAYFGSTPQKLQVTYQHRPTTGGSWVDSETIIYEINPDAAGYFEITMDTPIEGGYYVRPKLNSWKVTL